MKWVFYKSDPLSMDGLPDRWVGRHRLEGSRFPFELYLFRLKHAKRYTAKVRLPIRYWDDGVWIESDVIVTVKGTLEDAFQAGLQHAVKLLSEASVKFDEPDEIANFLGTRISSEALKSAVKELQDEARILRDLKQILPTLKHEGLPFSSSGVKP